MQNKLINRCPKNPNRVLRWESDLDSGFGSGSAFTVEVAASVFTAPAHFGLRSAHWLIKLAICAHSE